jgi:hypothetical protein
MSAKDIVLKPIKAAEANELVKRVHYSGKVVQNSQIHIGVFYKGKLEGAMQFGPSLDKRKIQGLVRNTGWNEFIELNRMAFSEALPRNSESRAIAIAMKILRKHAPHLKWVISFADGAQCGDGTIYRASGFVLTSIRKNKSLWANEHGDVVASVTMEKGNHIAKTKGVASMSAMKDFGFERLPGYQFRYIYFLNPACRQQLAVPIIPFDKIPDECRMYRGVRLKDSSEPTDDQSGEGGAAPTQTLHSPTTEGDDEG